MKPSLFRNEKNKILASCVRDSYGETVELIVIGTATVIKRFLARFFTSQIFIIVRKK